MATQYSSEARSPGFDQMREADAASAALSAATLAPLIAGARARGIADAMEMMGEGAILLDFAGTVLNVGPLAKPMLGCALAVMGNHVVALASKASRPLQEMIEGSLAEGGPRVLEADLVCAQVGMRQRVRAVRAPGGDCQLLATVLILQPPRRVRKTRRRAKDDNEAA